MLRRRRIRVSKRRPGFSTPKQSCLPLVAAEESTKQPQRLPATGDGLALAFWMRGSRWKIWSLFNSTQQASTVWAFW